MPEPNPSQLIVYAGIAVLIAWRLYSRLRRFAGRQKVNPRRSRITIVVFPILLALLLASSLARPLTAAALACGAGLGIALGLYGLRATRFEAGPAGAFYTPSTHLGIGLSVLVVARFVYLLVQIPFAATLGHAPPPDFVRSPLTLLLIGTLGAYYVTYAVGLLRWWRRAQSASGPQTAPK
jgi:hypothetical protein